MNVNFWKGKKVLITGHTGFKGSWLSFWLQTMSAEVIGYSLPSSTNPNLFNAAKIAENMKSYYNDIRDFDSLSRVTSYEKPDVVFHLAAQPLVRHSYSFPIETYSTNIMGTVNLLEALRKVDSVRVCIIITSDKCYDNQETVSGYREDDPMGGDDPYSCSKGCAELVTSSYRKSFFSQKSSLLLASVRAGNVIGGGDWSDDRLIPDFIRAVQTNNAVTIRNPKAVRPWQHVLEPLSGYLLLAQCLWMQGEKFTGGWNFGPNPDDAKTVEWVIENLIRLWGDGASWELDIKENPKETKCLKLDISKAQEQLQWHPRWPLEKALQAVIEWYRAFLSNLNSREIMFNQIREYSNSPVNG